MWAESKSCAFLGNTLTGKVKSTYLHSQPQRFRPALNSCMLALATFPSYLPPPCCPLPYQPSALPAIRLSIEPVHAVQLHCVVLISPSRLLSPPAYSQRKYLSVAVACHRPIATFLTRACFESEKSLTHCCLYRCSCSLPAATSPCMAQSLLPLQVFRLFAPCRLLLSFCELAVTHQVSPADICF